MTLFPTPLMLCPSWQLHVDAHLLELNIAQHIRGSFSTIAMPDFFRAWKGRGPWGSKEIQDLIRLF